MVDENAEGYIAGALPPEATEAIGSAVDWVGEKAGEAADWATQEVKDVGQSISDGIDTVTSWVKEHPESLID